MPMGNLTLWQAVWLASTARHRHRRKGKDMDDYVNPAYVSGDRVIPALLHLLGAAGMTEPELASTGGNVLAVCANGAGNRLYVVPGGGGDWGADDWLTVDGFDWELCGPDGSVVDGGASYGSASYAGALMAFARSARLFGYDSGRMAIAVTDAVAAGEA